MGWVMAGLGFHGLDMPKFIRPMTHPSSGPPQPSPFPARPIGLGQGSAMGWWAEPKPMRTICLVQRDSNAAENIEGKISVFAY